LSICFLSVTGMYAQVAQTQLVEKVERSSDPLVIPYEKWKLPNGLP
jgi:hypothetical protein